MKYTNTTLFTAGVPIRRVKKVTSVDIEGKTYILTSPKDHLIELNPTARFIWKALVKPKTLNELVSMTMKSFWVTAKEKKGVVTDITRFLSTLQKYQLLAP
jgi:hypothetical protein